MTAFTDNVIVIRGVPSATDTYYYPSVSDYTIPVQYTDDEDIMYLGHDEDFLEAKYGFRRELRKIWIAMGAVFIIIMIMAICG